LASEGKNGWEAVFERGLCFYIGGKIVNEEGGGKKGAKKKAKTPKNKD